MNRLEKKMQYDHGFSSVNQNIKLNEKTIGSNITSLVYNGNYATVGLGDGRIIKIKEDENPVTLFSHKGAVTSVIFSNGNSTISAAQDGKVIKHNQDNTTQTIFDSGEFWINSMSFSKKTNRLAVAYDKKILIYENQKKIIDFTSPTSTLLNVSFSPNGHELATACYNGVSIFDCQNPSSKEILSWKGSLIEASWSPDGRFVAAATQDREIHIWDFIDNKDFRLGGFIGKARNICWTANSAYLLSLGSDVIAAWPLAGGPGNFPPVEIGYAKDASLSSVAAGGEIDKIAGGFTNGSILIGNIRNSEAIIARAPDKNPITKIAWSPDYDKLVYGTRTGKIGFISFKN